MLAGDAGQPPLSDARERARKVLPRYAQGPLVRVATARHQAEAEMIEGLLLAEGIPSLIRRSGGFDVPDFLAAGPRDILVPSSGEELAREILAPVAPGDRETPVAPAAQGDLETPGAPSSDPGVETPGAASRARRATTSSRDGPGTPTATSSRDGLGTPAWVKAVALVLAVALVVASVTGALAALF